jgi:hypothetical protein
VHFLTSWQNVSASTTVSTITALLDRGFGADFATTGVCGWNALFYLVLNAGAPDSGGNLEAVRILLPVVGNVLAEGFDGLNLFDRVKGNTLALQWKHEAEVTKLSMDSISARRYGSYQQDLLYCALLRSGLYSLHDLPPPPAGPRFTRKYKPQHYRALLYLQSWDEKAGPTVLKHPLLNHDLLLDEERERAPAFHEWKISDLSAMERRLEHATFRKRKQKRKHGKSKKKSSGVALPGLSDGSPGKLIDVLNSDRSDLPVGERSKEPQEGCSEGSGRESRELGGMLNGSSNDSEEEGGVSLQGYRVI